MNLKNFVQSPEKGAVFAQGGLPVNTRRWANIKPALGQRLVLAGLLVHTNSMILLITLYIHYST